jgi:hypothetical protein
MKIVIFGLTISSSWGNGHATLWRGLCRAPAARGHRVIFFERDVPYYAAHRDLSGLAAGTLRLYGEREAVRGNAQRQLKDADVAIVTSYCPDGIAAAAPELCGNLQKEEDPTCQAGPTSLPITNKSPAGPNKGEVTPPP